MRRVLVLSVAALVTTLALAGPRALAGDEPASPESLIERLGSDDFRVREDASRDLAAMGAAARPALEKAMKESRSLEVRWRAEQILRRLDREGERGLEDGPATPERTEPRTAEREGSDRRERARDAWADQWRRLEEMERTFDEARKRMESRFGAWPSPMTPFAFGRKVEAPGLSLEVLPGGGAELRVEREETGGKAVREEVYRGKDLADILAQHPELADHPGMAELRRRADWLSPESLLEGFRFGPGTSTITMSSGVEIRQEPGKTTVTIREKGEDGKEKVTTVEGADLDEIRREHPELAEKLKGLSISFGPAVRIFGNRGPLEPRPRAKPERPAVPTPPTAPPAEAPVFGVHIVAVDEMLASHLGLVPGGGLLLHSVDSGSQAEAIGLRRHDVIVSVNGSPVRDGEAAALRQAAKDPTSPLTLEIVRAGKRMTLSR